MNKGRLFLGLALLNATVFLVATIFLPRAGSYSYHGPLSYYVHSRTDWHIAWLILASSILATVSIYLIATSRRP